MTTGLIFAGIFYFAALLIATTGAWFWTGGDLNRTLAVSGFIARLAGPAVIAPAGWVIGYIREKQRQEAEQRLAAAATATIRRPVQGAPMARAASSHAPRRNAPPADTAPTSAAGPATPAVRPLGPRPATTAIPVTPISPEVQEYLRQTSRVDLKGIRDFVRETRAHSLGELHRDAGLE